jgi:sterol desaturase/sphingolipid hydroxylase (fatty acid hydroxylase superfamily)
MPRRVSSWLLLLAGLATLVGLAVLLAGARIPPSSLRITATGGRAPAALGTEVWVVGVSVDGTPLALQSLEREGPWAERDGRLVSHEGQPATLSWRGPVYRALTLELVAHPYSGRAHVEWNGRVERLDLYDPRPGVRRVALVPALERSLARDAAAVVAGGASYTQRALSQAPYGFWFAVFGVFLVLESFRPAQQDQAVRDLVFNVKWMLLYVSVNALVAPHFTTLVGGVAARLGGGLVDLRFDAGERWDLLLASGLLGAFVGDFFYYWMHRLQHAVPVLWQQHKLHHSDGSVNVTTAHRHHWLEEPLRLVCILLPMGVLCELNPAVGGAIGLLIVLWGSFIHANLRLDLGILTPVVAGPQLHRIHHSFQDAHRDRNFAAFFPVFDVVFGTYYRPKRDEYPATGLTTGETTHSVAAASVWPFREWSRMLTPAVGRTVPER